MDLKIEKNMIHPHPKLSRNFFLWKLFYIVCGSLYGALKLNIPCINLPILFFLQFAVVMYRHYVHRNVTSMNFDNPVYRKTTEEQFALEKNGYAPGSKLYPSTVGEEVRALTAMECTLNIQNSLR